MCRPIRLQFRGRLIRLGEMIEDDAQSLHRGTGGSTYTRNGRATREAPVRGQGWSNRTPVRDRLGTVGWRRGFVVPLKPGNAGGGKGPRLKTDARRGEGPGDSAISTPVSIQKLQTALHAKAKAEPGYRFYSRLRRNPGQGVNSSVSQAFNHFGAMALGQRLDQSSRMVERPLWPTPFSWWNDLRVRHCEGINTYYFIAVPSGQTYPNSGETIPEYYPPSYTFDRARCAISTKQGISRRLFGS